MIMSLYIIHCPLVITKHWLLSCVDFTYLAFISSSVAFASSLYIAEFSLSICSFSIAVSFSLQTTQQLEMSVRKTLETCQLAMSRKSPTHHLECHQLLHNVLYCCCYILWQFTADFNLINYLWLYRQHILHFSLCAFNSLPHLLQSLFCFLRVLNKWEVLFFKLCKDV